MQNLVPAQPVVPDFTPVPRKYRYDGWTPDRQRAFIAALAETGSVKAAAKRINMSAEGAYYLRRQPGADGFRAAWAAALDHGVQTLTDIAIDRAIEGVPIPIFWKGEQVGEKRWFNDRLLMFILKHHAGGAAALHPGTRSAETIAREAAENCPVCRERAEAERAEADALATEEEEQAQAQAGFLQAVLRMYENKVRSERDYRRGGRLLAADFTLRQLTHLELILDAGDAARDLLDFYTADPDTGEQRNASAVTHALDAARRRVWAEAGEPRRPPLHLRPDFTPSGLRGGPTRAEREAAQHAAESRIAAAQEEWEAAAGEESWAERKARGGA